MTTEPDWLNPCEPTDPELLDSLKAEIERRNEEFMLLRNAAPDLLEALKTMCSLMTNGCGELARLPFTWREVFDQAEAAIAKAEGRDV